MSGWQKNRGGKMSNFKWGGKMSGWQNVWVAKCLGVKKSGCQNVLVSKCLGVKMSARRHNATTGVMPLCPHIC